MPIFRFKGPVSRDFCPPVFHDSATCGPVIHLLKYFHTCSRIRGAKISTVSLTPRSNKFTLLIRISQRNRRQKNFSKDPDRLVKRNKRYKSYDTVPSRPTYLLESLIFPVLQRNFPLSGLTDPGVKKNCQL